VVRTPRAFEFFGPSFRPATFRTQKKRHLEPLSAPCALPEEGVSRLSAGLRPPTGEDNPDPTFCQPIKPQNVGGLAPGTARC